MPDKIPVTFVTSKGFTKFSGYYFRVKKEMDCLCDLDEFDVNLCCLVKPSSNNPQYLKKIKNEITDKTQFLSINNILALRGILTKRSIVHAQGHRAFFNCWLATRLLLRKPKLVFDYHGAGPEENRELGGNVLSFFLVRIWEKLGVNKSDAVILVSNSFEEHLVKKYKLPKDKIYIIRNYIEQRIEELAVLSKEELRENLDLPKDKIILVYSGNLQQWQEPELLQTVAEDLNELSDRFVFLLLSRDPKAGVLAKSKSVILREVSRNEVFQYLRASDIGLLLRKPNLINQVSDPTKLGEYLFCGLSIFTSGVGDLRQMISDMPGVGYYYSGTMYPADNLLADLESFVSAFRNKKPNKHSIGLYEKYYSNSAAKKELLACYNKLISISS